MTLVIVSHKRNGLAIVEFANSLQANIAYEFEKGLEENPCTVSWVETPRPKQTEETTTVPREEPTAFPSTTTAATNRTMEKDSAVVPDVNTEEDFEALVLRRLRQAEERKRLSDQIIQADKDAGDEK